LGKWIYTVRLRNFQRRYFRLRNWKNRL